jgi:predicted DsbA family dithiol-disulfide isomerase
VPNSHAALRITELARSQGKHGVTHDRLMLAYWEEGQNIGDPAVLRALAAELEVQDAETAISGERGAEAIAQATSQAHAIGINAIPAFLLDRRLIVLGAQPAETFERAFEHLQRQT